MGVTARWRLGTRTPICACVSAACVELPDEQSYPGLAQRHERIVRNLCDVTSVKRNKDIDTFYLRIAQINCLGFSSGHNYPELVGWRC